MRFLAILLKQPAFKNNMQAVKVYSTDPRMKNPFVMLFFGRLKNMLENFPENVFLSRLLFECEAEAKVEDLHWSVNNQQCDQIEMLM